MTISGVLPGVRADQLVRGDVDGGFATAVITGGGGGMGVATARVLASKGWHVVCVDRNEQSLHRLKTELGQKCTVLPLEVQNPELIDRVLEVLAHLPPVRALVNMAGVSQGGTLNTLTEQEWALAFAVNVTPALRLIQALGPLMQQQKTGSIINVGSPVGIVGARKPQYAASKAALHGLTMSAARALGPDGVRVNLLLPGPTITGMTADWSNEQRDSVAQGTFLKRMCQPEEIGKMVAFLVGEDSAYLTASVIDMTAGSMMGH
jgi:NAD(P)-dependent dehydrogenase (short-subunit alcohol dehydrogenase family)